jgi:CheY-like chemotaxis protein
LTKILVVEDNETNRKLFRLMLRSAGFEVIEANDGASGVEVAKVEQPDLIIMDIQLPVLDGMRAFEILQDDSATNNIPVIAATSYAMKGDEEKILAMGFAAYLAKPISLDFLLQAIQAILGE